MSSPDIHWLGGIVLCGGHSRRMGRSKPDLPFGDETLLTRIVRLLGRVVTGPVVVVSAAKPRVWGKWPVPVVIAHDRFPDRGPLEGIATGLAHLPAELDAAYVTSCDVPFLQPDFVHALGRRLGNHEAAVPVDPQFTYPLAAIYRRSVQNVIDTLLSHDQRRASQLIDHIDAVRVPTDDLQSADPELLTLHNINTPELYEAALRRLGHAR